MSGKRAFDEVLGVGGALHGFLRAAGLEDALLQHQAWDRAAGELLAKHVRPVRRRDGVLYLEADSPKWAKQAETMTAHLLPRVQAEGLAVDRLVVRLAKEP